MKVSIVMPCYNSEKYVRDSILSVVGQTYSDWELLVVDDCSTDKSIEVIEPFLEDNRIKLFRNATNRGPVFSRNFAMENASGEIIAFLDSDDRWYDNKLEKQIALYERAPDTAMVYADYEHIDAKGEQTGKVLIAPESVGYKDILKTCSIGCLTATYNRKLLGKRYFIEHGHEDYILWLSILKQGYLALNVGEVLAQYRITNDSISANKFRAAGWQWSIYRNIEKLGLLKSLWYFSTYFLYGVRNHYLK